MATLEWGDVVIIGLVAFAGFTLLSYGISAWMSRHNVSGQVKAKPRKPAKGKPAKGEAAPKTE